MKAVALSGRPVTTSKPRNRDKITLPCTGHRYTAMPHPTKSCCTPHVAPERLLPTSGVPKPHGMLPSTVQRCWHVDPKCSTRPWQKTLALSHIPRGTGPQPRLALSQATPPVSFGITTCPGRVSSGATRPPSLVCNLLFCRIVVVSGASHGCHEQASYTNQRGQTSASVHLTNAATCYPSVWQCSEALGCATSPRTLWQAKACGGTSVCAEGRQNTRGRVALRHSLRGVCASEI
jgi:hypothetical protein